MNMSLANQLTFQSECQEIALHAPWLHSIRHMTSPDGVQVFWKHKLIASIVGVFNDCFASCVKDFAWICERYEEINVPININTVLHYSHWFMAMDSEARYKSILTRCPEIWTADDRIALIFQRAIAERVVDHWIYYDTGDSQRSSWATSSWLDIQGYSRARLRTKDDLPSIINCLNCYEVPDNLFEEMAFSLNPRRLQ